MVSHADFTEILKNFSVVVADRQVPSKHMSPAWSDYGAKADTESWWLAADRSEAPLTKRTKAFVFAYVAVFGSTLRARGGQLSDGSFVLWDKGIMKKLLKEDLVALENGALSFTPAGLELFLGRET